MPRCQITFQHLSEVGGAGPYFIRAKWGRDSYWCQTPHITPQTTFKKAENRHVWGETIIIQSNFNWKKDSLVLHVFEAGFISNAHVGDATVVFNQLVARQPTPLSLPLVQNLGQKIIPGKLAIHVTALDFGHELVQFAPQAPTFQPHYFVASSAPIAPGPSAAAPNGTAYTMANGQQIYLQPMGTMPVNSPAPGTPAVAPIQPLMSSALPTANGGFMFYAMPNAAGAQPMPSHSSTLAAPAPSIQAAAQLPAYPGLPSDPAPPYPGLDISQQYTADFTYEAPSAPVETVIQDDFNPRAGRPASYSHAIVEQAPPPAPRPTLFPDGDSLI